MNTLFFVGVSSNGRIADSDSVRLGSSPGTPAKLDKSSGMATFLFAINLYWNNKTYS